jgi:SAM-dependent methyltransferase
MSYSETRYNYLPKRTLVWREIVRYLQGRFDFGESVLDAGCGYGDFISNVKAARRFAVDLDGGMAGHLPADVEFRQGSIAEIDKYFPEESMNFVFSSNVLEHLSRDKIDQFFKAAHTLLKAGGQLGILMPNYKRAYREYFDDYTHVTPISDTALVDWLAASGFTSVFSHPGFMPYSMKDSRVPVAPILVRAWLWSPWKPGGKQMLVVARKS